MSESEKFEAQGRAHAALKLARANAATIKARLLQYGKDLEETAGMVRLFVEDPTYVNPKESRSIRSQSVKGRLQSIRPDEILGLVDELVKEASAARELQQQIDQF